MNSQNYWKKIGIPIIVALRLILPLFLWWNALIATILVLLADLADGEVFRRAFAFQNNAKYQQIDKALDFYGYIFVLIYSVRFPIFNILLFLFLWRMLGAILLFVKKDRKYLVLCPNIFESIFVVYLLTFTFPSLTFLFEATTLYITLFVLSVITVIREYFLHIREIQLYEFRTGKRWV